MTMTSYNFRVHDECFGDLAVSLGSGAPLNIAPVNGTIETVSKADTANGWTAALAKQAWNSRNRSVNFVVGPRGIAVGPTARPSDVSDVPNYMCWVRLLRKPLTSARQRAAMSRYHWHARFTQDLACAGVYGVDLGQIVKSTEVFYDQATVDRNTDNIPADECWFDIDDYDDKGVSCYRRVKFSSVNEFRGVKYLAVGSGTVYANNGLGYANEPRTVRLIANCIYRKGSELVIPTIKSEWFYPDATYQPEGVTSGGSGDIGFLRDVINRGSTHNNFGCDGISLVSGIAYGWPECQQSAIVRGDVTRSGYSLSVDNPTCRQVRWSGALILTLSQQPNASYDSKPTVSSEDELRISNTEIVSQVFSQQQHAGSKLWSRTASHQLMDSADVDTDSPVMLPSHEGSKPVTFATVGSRVAGRPYTMFHVSRGEVSLLSGMRVQGVKDATGTITVSSSILDGDFVVYDDLKEAYGDMVAGAVPVSSETVTADELIAHVCAYTGFSSIDSQTWTDKGWTDREEFNERAIWSYFQRLDELPDNVLAAQTMVQFAQDRSVMTQILAGCMVNGRRTFKRCQHILPIGMQTAAVG